MENKFQIHTTLFNNVFIVERSSPIDSRGSFEKLFCSNELEPIWGERNIQQNNISFNLKAGTIRGFHYQVGEYCESKLVSCIRGSIFDVIVDVRKDSHTFGKWASFELSSKNNKAIFIPEGFAHGYQTLESDVIINYCHSGLYKKTHERGINVFDKVLNVNWPVKNFVISERDKTFPNLNNSDTVTL